MCRQDGEFPAPLETPKNETVTLHFFVLRLVLFSGLCRGTGEGECWGKWEWFHFVRGIENHGDGFAWGNSVSLAKPAPIRHDII